MKLSRDEQHFLKLSEKKAASREAKLEYYRSEREKGRPHAYITGEVEFFDLRLKVNESCLIPRLESELLVEKVLERLPESGRVLDLCCGSGALGLSIKSKRPDLEVILSDKSGAALDIAKENAQMNGLDVELVLGDFLEPFEGQLFDVIVCNPPYITEDEYSLLEKSVKGFEPKMALVGGDDGLKFYKLLAEGALQVLVDDGFLCLEIGKDQGKVLEGLFSDVSWAYKLLEKDYSSHDRFFFLEKRGRCQ